MFETIIGHGNVKVFLEKAVASGRVSHAYLFLGPERVGKMAVAREFTLNLLRQSGLPVTAFEQYPDIKIVSRLTDEKTEIRKSGISIEQIRELRTFLSFSSFLPSWKIAIIEDAHAMTSEAATALLKTLEEPRGKTMLILIASDARFIPETIRSRTQVIRFGLVPRRQIEESLLARNLSHIEAERFTRVSRGRPGIALSFCEDKKMFHDYIDNLRKRDQLLDEPVYSRLRWTEMNAKKIKSDTLAEEFRLWREVLRDRLLVSLGISEFAVEERKQNQPTVRKTPLFIAQLHLLAEAEAAARHFVDPRLAVEYFLLADTD